MEPASSAAATVPGRVPSWSPACRSPRRRPRPSTCSDCSAPRKSPWPRAPRALPYALKVQGTDDSDLEKTLEDTSTLHRLRREPPPDGEGLVRRAEADIRRLPDALSGYGYYAGPCDRADRGGGARRRGVADRRRARRGIRARPRPGSGPHRRRCRAALYFAQHHRARPARAGLRRGGAAAALHPYRRRDAGALQPRARPRGEDRRPLPRTRPSLREGGVARSRRGRRRPRHGRDLHRRSRPARRPRRGHRPRHEGHRSRGGALLHLRGAGRPVRAEGARRHAPGAGEGRGPRLGAGTRGRGARRAGEPADLRRRDRARPQSHRGLGPILHRRRSRHPRDLRQPQPVRREARRSGSTPTCSTSATTSTRRSASSPGSSRTGSAAGCRPPS